MIQGCNRAIRMRGLCNGCYTAARKYVTRGWACWQSLEQLGLILPARTRQPGPFHIAYEAAIAAKKKDSPAQRRKRKLNGSIDVRRLVREEND